MSKEELSKKIKDSIKEKGYTMEKLSKELGITRQSLHNKTKLIYEFTAFEYIKLKELLDIDNDLDNEIIKYYEKGAK